MDDPEAAAAMLARLRALGVRVSIDDFGTGHSSLSYLHRFPIDTLKIDRSFVARMDGTAEGAGIIQTILALAHGLNIGVIAEGVETAEQRAFLASLACEYAQGYYFSRPVNPAAAAAMLEAGGPRPGAETTAGRGLIHDR
jgi:EAL domain-containing protein (putative c-di-GMP-specific phosphodiesterase class I)